VKALFEATTQRGETEPRDRALLWVLLHGLRARKLEALEAESPLFLSESNNSPSDRLGYWGIYNVVKELGAIAGVKDAHPRQGRHTVATEMVSRGMDPLLARQKSEKSFERYSKRSLQKQAEAQFLGLMGEG
jgi:integrase/recombinase XerD